MSARVIVHKIGRAETVERQVPDNCPGCRADLREEGSIVQQGWEISFRNFHHDPDSPGELYADGDARVSEDSEGMVQDYRCARCNGRVDQPVGRPSSPRGRAKKRGR